MEEQSDQTCHFYKTDPNLPFRFNNPNCFHGNSQKNINPFYRTTNQTYGSRKPTVHEIQTQYRGTSRQFSETMLKSGMYCDHGFNTSVDKSRVMAPMATQTRRSDLGYLIHHVRQFQNQEGST
ncbi:piercer of microtubule wall 2 protein [Cynoglossus semilaevis]|nr:UPF0691 protein C9orf116 homolog [Cynoglossus semilaevis]